MWWRGLCIEGWGAPIGPLANIRNMLQKCRMRTAFFCAALMVPLLGATTGQAAAQVHSPSADRQRFLAVVRSLEATPLNPALLKDRAWAVQWLDDAPDITVSLCLNPIGGVSDKTYPNASNVIVQYALAMGAFIIKNPDRQGDLDAQQLAGVESALKAYLAMRTVQPAVTSPEFEKLLEMQRRGELSGFVREAYARCLSEDEERKASTPAPAKSATWEQVWDQQDIAIIYVDRSSITASDDLRSISTRTIYRTPLPNGYIAERIRVEEFDCKLNRSRIRKVTILANDSRPPQTIEWTADESQWSTFEADSVGATKSNIACGRKATRK